MESGYANATPDLVRFAPAVGHVTQRNVLAMIMPGTAVERTYRIVPGLCRVTLGGGMRVEKALAAQKKAHEIDYGADGRE